MNPGLRISASPETAIPATSEAQNANGSFPGARACHRATSAPTISAAAPTTPITTREP